MLFRRLALLAAVAAGVVALAHCDTAAAHDHWIAAGGYLSPTDQSRCCGASDCFVVERVEETAAGYLIPGLRETVPFREVMTSQDGQFWRCRKPDGSRRCFFAPPQSM